MKAKNTFFLLLVLLCLVGLCFYPRESAAAAVKALQTCGLSVIPALFPFFVLTKLLTTFIGRIEMPRFFHRLMVRFFGVSGNCFSPLLMSFLGGYPVGASCVVSLFEKGIITKSEANQALLFCNNSGPAFFIGVVGSVVLRDVRLGIYLYVIHVFSAVLVGMLFYRNTAHQAQIRRLPEETTPVAGQFPEAIGSSCAALLQICGLIIFFSVILGLLDAVGLFSLVAQLPSTGLTSKQYRALVSGILELTGGILALENTPNAAVFSAFFMGWGGLCVHLQAKSLWYKSGLNPKGYYPSKFFHGLISAILTYCLLCNSLVYYILLFLFVLLLLLFAKIHRKRGRKKFFYAV